MNWLILVQVPAAAAAAYVRFMLTIWFAVIVAFVVCILVVCGLPKGEPRERTY